MPDRAWIRGQVVEAETGRPIPLASLFSGPTRRPVGVCDEQGRFRVGLDAGLVHEARARGASSIDLLHGGSLQGSYLAASIVAHSEGFLWTSAPLWVGAEDADVQIPLARAGRLTGQVTHPDGSPAQGARVFWQEAPGRFFASGASTLLDPGKRSLTVGDDGRFEMASVTCAPDREGILEVRYGDLPPIEIAEASPRSPDEPRHHEVVLLDQPGLPGRLLVNGAPEFGYVYVVDEQGELGRGVKTDPAGHFSIKSLPPGVHTLRACTGDGSALFSVDHRVEVPYDEASPFEIRIQAQFDEVRGHVTGADGGPAAGVSVFAIRQTRKGFPGVGMLLAGSGETGPDGSFHLRFEPAEDPVTTFYTIKCYAEGAAQEVIDVTAGRDDVAFVIPRFASAALRVLDAATGTPVRSVRLGWHDLGSGARARLAGGMELDLTSKGALSVRLPLGPIDLDVSSEGYESRTMRGLRVPEGGSNEDLVIELERR